MDLLACYGPIDLTPLVAAVGLVTATALGVVLAAVAVVGAPAVEGTPEAFRGVLELFQPE